MKKVVFVFLIAVVTVCCALEAVNESSKTDLSCLTLANVEALSSQEDTSGYSNTGPAEEKRCYGGGHRMVCRCINSHPCSGTDCY
ncbi:NVEALA domain-containing protein [Duncaniella muris]|uniref:NVEALA domain-containing protein n=1 Tax=Duncaniella muris TaxID=2094150 RepID=UPI0025A95668|nr:NVEALA domain-containing protein [Duncaniella muris]